LILRHVPPPLCALIFLAATYGLSLLPGLRDAPAIETRPVGLIIIVAALAISTGAMLQFRLARTEILPTSRTNRALVTNGLYALTRNPMYLAMTLFSLGAALWFERTPMLFAPVLMFAIANWVFIPFEEEKMRRQFGETFDAYCRRVRRWL
jgi:protein-S-isoprenylcysteine O-methyltransferase Ste14